jgi:hypothetical protein
MLQAVVAKGVSAENVAAVEAIVKLYERMEERSSEKEFAQAFVQLQGEMPKVQATKPVPNKDGSVRFRFAPFEDLMAQVGPILQRHGFTVSFSSRVDGNRIISTCTLQHHGGHKRSNDFAVRIGSGPPAASEAQSDGAAATYAKRFALTESLNIVVAHLDSDARLEGGMITSDQAEELARRVAETNSNRAAFLKLAGAKDFTSIAVAKYDILDEMLASKERRKK